MEDIGSKTKSSIMILLLLLFLVPVLNTPMSEQQVAAKQMRDGTQKPIFNFHQDSEKMNIRKRQLIEYESEVDGTHYNTTAEVIRAKELCQSSLILISSGGQFGNWFMEWASALGIAKRLDAVLVHDKKREIAMANEVVERLKRVFNGVEQKTVNEVMTNRRVQLSTGKISCFDLLPFKDSLLGRVVDNLEQVYYRPKRVAGNMPLTFNVLNGFEPAVASVAKDLREDLSFRNEIRDRAESKLRFLVKYVKTKTHISQLDEDTKVIVVGIHVRHADLELVSDYYRHEPPNHTYFVNALRWMLWTLRTNKSRVSRTFQVKTLPLRSTSLRKKVDRLAPKIVTPPRRQELPTLPLIAVAIISDDMPWVKKKLIPALKEYIVTDEVSGVHLFQAGSNKPMVDLALLSQCNHTIISFGNFGVTGAILSGGMTVVYNMHYTGNFAENLVKFFPHWVLME